MPIKGVGDRPQRIGNIKIGKKGAERKGAHGTYRLPEKAMDFTITTMERDPDTDDWVIDEVAMQWLKDQFGKDKPIQVPIMLLADDIDSNFRCNMEAWKASDLICSGDQETAVVKATGEAKTCPCEWKEKDGKGVKKCKPHGALNVVLPFAGRVGGIYRFSTTSWHSCGNITATLRQIQAMTGGVLMGLPLMLTVTPTKVYPKGSDKSSTVPIVGIHYEGDTMALLEAAKSQTQARLASGVNMKRLEAIASGALDDSPEDKRDWVTEFAPQAEQEMHQTAEKESLANADVPEDVQAAATTTATEPPPETAPEHAPPADGVFRREDLIWRGNHAGMPWNDKRVSDAYLATIYEQLDTCLPDDKMYCDFAGEEIAARMDAAKAEQIADDDDAHEEELQDDANATSGDQESMY